MSLPIKSNTTCDIYRSGNSPPSAPDVADVPCFLRPAYREGKEASEGDASNTFTHILLVAADVDIRDGYSGDGTYGSTDSVYIPADATTPEYKVKFVERVDSGGTLDHKRVFLDRQSVNWPASNL